MRRSYVVWRSSEMFVIALSVSEVTNKKNQKDLIHEIREEKKQPATI